MCASISQIYIQARIYIHAVIGNAEMEVVTGSNTSCASQPDLLSGTHNCTAADAEAAQVHVDRFVSFC